MCQLCQRFCCNPNLDHSLLIYWDVMGELSITRWLVWDYYSSLVETAGTALRCFRWSDTWVVGWSGKWMRGELKMGCGATWVSAWLKESATKGTVNLWNSANKWRDWPTASWSKHHEGTLLGLLWLLGRAFFIIFSRLFNKRLPFCT